MRKALIRVIIKEYIKNKTINDKYYYHQLEYIDNNKIEGSSDTLPRNAEVRTFKSSPSSNNIPQNNEEVNYPKEVYNEEVISNVERKVQQKAQAKYSIMNKTSEI